MSCSPPLSSPARRLHRSCCGLRGARPGVMLPRKPALIPPSPRSSPGCGYCCGSDVRVWRAPSDSWLSWERAGSPFLPLSFPRSLFSKEGWSKRSSLPNLSQIEIGWGKTFNSARSAGRRFGCKIRVSISPLKKPTLKVRRNEKQAVVRFLFCPLS